MTGRSIWFPEVMENPDAILGHLMANDAWVRTLAHRLVADPHVAEDVAQEAWLAALTNPPRKGSAARSWFGRVVRNFVRLRRQGDANRRARQEGGRAAAELPAFVPNYHRAGRDQVGLGAGHRRA